MDNFQHPLSGPGMLAVVTVVGGDSDRLTPAHEDVFDAFPPLPSLRSLSSLRSLRFVRFASFVSDASPSSGYGGSHASDGETRAPARLA
ncbi:hypothetical protein ACIQMV_05985 [Streptomyces sp. NPDC091412]|uniref:hypothetical protein n=1 Tax=Streptomyces sp. NPDC091412 TaxID=3366002 RepID=UPI003819C138